MRQADDTLTIDLYAAPKRPAVADDFRLNIDSTPDLYGDTNKMTGFSIDIEHAKRPFTSVKELDSAKQELTVIEETANLRHGVILDESAQSLAVELGVNLSQDGLELIQDAAMSMGKAATFLVKSGLELMAAKSRCQHGEFDDFCSRVGIVQSRASEAMRYAQFAATLDPKERGKYLLLPKKSALLLANAEPALVEFLLEDGNEELARKLRKRSELVELARELTETEDALSRHAKENELLHKENKMLREFNDVRVAGSEYPAAVVQLRKESAVLADEAIASLSSIRYNADNFDYLGVSGNPEQDERNLYAAMYPTLANIVSIMRTAETLLNDLCARYDLNTADIAGHCSYAFPAAELALIEAARETMLSRKAGKAASRQGQYLETGDMTRGRGRPRKGA